MYEDQYDEPVVAGEPIVFKLPGWIACAPFEEYLEMTIDEARDGRAVLFMPFRVKHSQGQGLMHGGAITALADTAVAMAIKSLLPEGSNFVTTELTLKFHAPVRHGTVTAKATVEPLDERSFRGVAEVLTDDGVNVATFTALFRIPRSKPKL